MKWILSRLIPNTLSKRITWQTAPLVAAIAWYIGLFPGRIGYDPIQAINLMRINQSTDWWTSWYFRVLEFSTFGGKSIWFASLLSISVLYSSFVFFSNSLPIKQAIRNKITFLVCISPLFGNFAVTLSHDTYFVSGILLLVGYSYKLQAGDDSRMMKFIPISAVALLLTSRSGYVVLFSFLVYLFFQNIPIIKILKQGALMLVLFALSNLGITKTNVPLEIMPAVADIKCVAQHMGANISNSEWYFLSTINPIENWKKPTTCSSMDEALVPLTNSNINSVDKGEFFKKYLSIVTKNAAIVIQAHLQRSSMALPPPFFQGPQNQVDQDIHNPVGQNTNTALQLGPEVLHPSIDDQSLKIELGPFKYIQYFLLLPSFLINQASWFWGWGGLWLWPTLLIPIVNFKLVKLRNLLFVSYPILINHLFLFLFSPIPAPRYVMSTVLIGLTFALIAIFEWFDKIKSRR